jgi:NAD(P)-dependent dehydrogenase (short-subunit alcohol dehydrogenase family)
LGRAVALAAGAAGADVAIMARDPRELAATEKAVLAVGGDVLAVAGSVTEGDCVVAVASAIRERWGRIDALVNNAGISPSLTRTENLSISEWHAVLDTNLTGSFLCAREAGRVMLEQGKGAIVNVTSVHGQVGAPRLAAYAASKGGLQMLTRVLAVEWADRGVRVNAVAPGYLETQMTAGMRGRDAVRDSLLDRIPARRFGVPEDVTSAIVYLCSDASSYVTGATINIDGGWSAQ